MTDPIETLLAHPNVKLENPAEEDDIEEVEDLYESPLPPELLEVWDLTNGFWIDELCCRFFGPDEIYNQGAVDYFAEFGMLPFLDESSNTVYACLNEPLAPRTIFLPKGNSYLLTRSIPELFRLIVQLLNEKEEPSIFDLETMGFYMNNDPRSAEDQDLGLELLRTLPREQVRSTEDDMQWGFAVQLLDESNHDAWVELLELDCQIRPLAEKRMAEMKSPEIVAILDTHRRSVQQFIEEVAEHLKAKRYTISEIKGEIVGINDRWIDVGSFYHRRHAPKAMKRIRNWIADLLKSRNPHDRSDHIFVDWPSG